MNDQDVRKQLHNAVSALAGTCDGAISRDDVGFSKAHTYNGRILAMIPLEDWPTNQDWSIWNVLRIYKKQLERLHGIRFDDIPEPKNGRADLHVQKRVVWVLQGCWMIEFPYHDRNTFKDGIIGCGGTFNGGTDPKRWEVPDSRDARDLIEELDYLGFYLTGGARELLASPVPDNRAVPTIEPQGDLAYEGGKFIVTFDKYKRDLREAVKEIPGRYFSWDDLHWEVPLRQHEMVTDLVVKFNLNVTPEARTILDNPPQVKPANRIELDGDVIRVYFDYCPDIHAKIKGVPGRRFLGEDDATKATGSPDKHWTIPIDQAPHVLKLCDDFDVFQCEDQVLELAAKQTEKRSENIQRSRAAKDTLQVDGLRGTLFPFQSAGVRYLVDNERVILGDVMGLGKTVMALAGIHYTKSYPAVVVCPAHLKLNWQREARKWLPEGTRIQVLNGRKSVPIGDHDLYIINYDILSSWVEVLISLDPLAVIMDESHYVKNYKAKRSKASKQLVNGVRFRWGLTGTAVLKHPQELINQLQIIDQLDGLGGFWHFAKQYCGYSRYQGFGNPRNLEELNLKMREICFIRRTKEEVLPELPDKLRSTVPVKIDNRTEYERAEYDVINYLRERKGEEASASALAAEAIVRLNTLRQLTGRGKIKAAIDWIENFLESGEKLIVFAHHVAVTQAIAKHFDAPFVTGGVSSIKKEAAVQAFQDDPDVPLIVGNLQAMGTGLTLTAASHVLLIEYDWTPANLDQAEDRAHRIGQKDSVNCYYLSAAGTIDQYFQIMLAEKREIVKATMEGNPVKERNLVAEMVEALLSANEKGKATEG